MRWHIRQDEVHERCLHAALSESIDQQRQDVGDARGIHRPAVDDCDQCGQPGHHQAGAELQDLSPEAWREARRRKRCRQEADRKRQKAQSRGARTQVEPALEILGQQDEERREHRKEAEPDPSPTTNDRCRNSDTTTRVSRPGPSCGARSARRPRAARLRSRAKPGPGRPARSRAAE